MSEASLALGAPARAPGSALRACTRVGRAGLVALSALGRLPSLRGGATPAVRAGRFHELCAEAIDAHDLDLCVRGDLPRGPAVIVANHVSWLDPLAILALLPVLPVAKAEVARWPIVGPLARRSGALFLERGNVRSGARVLRAMLRGLAEGTSILNFPEGTTSAGGSVLPFKRGAFGVARLAAVPVVPIALAYEARALAWIDREAFLPHYLRVAARETVGLTLHVCEPIFPGRLDRDGDIAERARAAIARALHRAACAPAGDPPLCELFCRE